MKKNKEEFVTSNFKWVVQLDYQGNIVFLNQEEYESYSDEIMKDNPKPLVRLKRTGEFITTKPISVQPNPTWIDPEKKAKILRKRQLLEEYEDLKGRGIVKNVQEFLDFKKIK